MKLEDIRRFCLSLPGTTEGVQWGNDLLFRIREKMYCVVCLEPESATVKMSFKCTPENFADLTEREGIVPAPYLARYHWVGLERFDALPADEMRRLIRHSYEMVESKAPKAQTAKKTQTKKTALPATKKPPRRDARRSR